METRNDILKELEELSPRLAAMEKTNPFSIPEGYFNRLDEHIMAAVKAERVEAELTEAPQLLAKHADENPFSVPYQYFERFPDKLLAKIAQEKPTPLKKLQRDFPYSVRTIYLMAALPIAAILVIVLLMFKPQTNNLSTPAVAISSLTSQDIQSYLSSNLVSLDEQAIENEVTMKKGRTLSAQDEIKNDVKDPSLIDISQVDLSSIENL